MGLPVVGKCLKDVVPEDIRTLVIDEVPESVELDNKDWSCPDSVDG